MEKMTKMAAKIKPCRHGLPLTRCKECTKEYRHKYMKEYRKLPQIKERHKELDRKYRSRPEVKAHLKEYHKAYQRRPDVIKRAKKYYKQPKVKLYMKEYLRKYNKSTEAKAYQNIQIVIRRYNNELKRLNSHIKEEWRFAPIQLQDKQLHLLDLIHGLERIKLETADLPPGTKAKERTKRVKELLTYS